MAKPLGTLLKTARRKSGLSQAGLAQLAGVGKTAVFDLEHGKDTVQLDTLLKVLRVLNIRIELAGPFGERLTIGGPES